MRPIALMLALSVSCFANFLSSGVAHAEMINELERCNRWSGGLVTKAQPQPWQDLGFELAAFTFGDTRPYFRVQNFATKTINEPPTSWSPWFYSDDFGETEDGLLIFRKGQSAWVIQQLDSDRLVVKELRLPLDIGSDDLRHENWADNGAPYIALTCNGRFKKRK